MSETQFLDLTQDFRLESGKTIPNMRIGYQTFGTKNEAGNNVIWAFHALTANSNVLDWWKGLFGEGEIFDPNKHFIICANVIGSPYGSTMPEDLDFPIFSVRDVVNAHVLLAEYLEIDQVFVAIGGSFGGNQALEFAFTFPGSIDHLILIASCSRESAWSIAVHESQRMALAADTSFGQKGQGESGMKAARAIGMLTYRTMDSFVETQTDDDITIDNFKASSYLQYQGDKFVKRFDALSYYYLTKCLDSHNVGRGRGGERKALSELQTNSLIIGISSDILIPVRFQRFMAQHIPNATLHEIHSTYGHDGFLVETQKLSHVINDYLGESENGNDARRAVLKFGGSSLGDKEGIEQVISIIQEEAVSGIPIVVLSARGKSTDLLLSLYQKASVGEEYQQEFDSFFVYQNEVCSKLDLSTWKSELSEVLKSLAVLKVDNSEIKARIVSFGELISVHILEFLLREKELDAVAIDAREIIRIHAESGEVDYAASKQLTLKKLSTLKSNEIPIITGFIARDDRGKTCTLGRNGSNYSASLIASFVNASELQNWTDVNGIYTANPKYVSNAKRIEELSYREANELANFGTTILHPKTIAPLFDKNIPLKILNTRNASRGYTRITRAGVKGGIKAISVIEDVALVSLEGRGMQDRVGIDGRIFSALGENNISVRLISQASSELGIGFVINKADAQRTEKILTKIFRTELSHGLISNINVNEEVAIVNIIGRHNYALEKAIHALRKNRIWMYLISNSISGEHISLVIDESKLHQAANLVHDEVF